MSPNLKRLAVGALVLGGAACAESITGADPFSTLADAFLTTPVGYSATNSSFAGSGDPGMQGGWMPGGDHGGRNGRGGRGGRGGPGGGFMGGGMDGLFMGDGFGPGFGHGHMGDPSLEGTCTFNASTSRVECTPVTHDGLTITRSSQYKDAAGTVQQAFDSVTTNSINVKVSVSGTVTHHDRTSTVANASDRTVTGVAKGSTTRTVNGTSAGKETTTGTDSAGAAFTAVRVASDTTANVVIPVPTSTTEHPYPTSGTVVRNMAVSLTSASGTKSSTRREVLTFDGSANAKLVITQDGTTRTCSVPLPHGRPTCQ
jgi:hypothetical protein